MAVLRRTFVLRCPFIGRDKQHKMSVNLLIFSYPSIVTFALGGQKKRQFLTVLLSIHNIYLGREIRNILFNFAPIHMYMYLKSV